MVFVKYPAHNRGQVVFSHHFLFNLFYFEHCALDKMELTLSCENISLCHH